MTALQDKKCLVTGAASGIGRATAIAAAARGAVVFLTDVRPEPLAEVAALIAARGGVVGMAQALDIRDNAAVQAFAARIAAEHGSLDIVMNIAGVSLWGPVERLRASHWQRMIDVNLMGPIHVIEAFVPAMVEAGRGGHIVNVSSAAGLFGLPWHAAYSASKFGLRGLSEVLRFDLERHRIGVSLVCPGGVRTGLVDTIEVLGVDMGAPEAAKLKRRFERHAITPEQAAERILRGVERNQYLVFTSLDIRLGYWLQRWFPWGYALLMRGLNAEVERTLGRIARRAPPMSTTGTPRVAASPEVGA